MQETNEKLILTFENVYKENSYRGYQIDDLTDFKSESIDVEMEDIKEDIIANIKAYLNIENNTSSFIYNDIETILEGDFLLDYTIETVDVVFHDHYTYDDYKHDNSLYIDMYEDHCLKIENKYEELDHDISQEQMDVFEDALHEETQEFIDNTSSYIANEGAYFISNYYYTVDVVITLTKSIF
ncbi:hypothetical protein FA592_03060 [Sulfurospirillum diekertiae]|uniref:Uncharacterized protein n=1 Tax=Sulfurospirillum diekertiae TaxID=1854492 RepID=A0A6G9VQN6_9BACT|nr:hypothetical protein [Sulfurospirillum diekertiae]QIR75260.1 hypothetical protein FA584_03160 [Sulfurospirillum diekertiae]QIR77912.1 hypothetical protein FA592_03060 [Sulfurospirillum diekertiae]